jgi:hypothetical protein
MCSIERDRWRGRRKKRIEGVDKKQDSKWWFGWPSSTAGVDFSNAAWKARYNVYTEGSNKRRFCID